jgi:hypothetical protein
VAAVRYGRGYAAGLGVGTLAGVVAAVPLGALVAGLFLAYTVGSSALGGLAGVGIERHTDWDLHESRWL